VHEGGCVNPCPENYVADGISCREWELKDAGIIPFPFLIATLIFIVICLFGRMKKRAFISKGKMAIKSPQNTITCIIICIAPFQFLATIAQAFLSYVYKTNTFCYLAIAVIVLIMSVNMFYAVWFGWKFDSKKIPDEIERKVRLFKMSRKEAEKHKVYKDEKF
jgi:amino acid permease